jgi:small subunit ribosomal protein S15
VKILKNYLQGSGKSSTFAPAFDDATGSDDVRAASERCIILTKNIIIMYLDKAKKEEIFGQYGKSTTDTGSAEAQIALFTFRIKHLTEHLKKNRKDFGTARSLTKMVGRRRKLLKYLYDNDINRYRAIIKALGLRK